MFVLGRRCVSRAFSTGRRKGGYSERQHHVVSTLRSFVQHPETGHDIIREGNVRKVTEDNGVVSVFLTLDDHYRSIRREILSGPVKQNLPWVKQLNVHMAEEKNPELIPEQQPKPKPKEEESLTQVEFQGLSKVKRIIAVSSCKGGVGKSTVSVNLAYALRAAGHNVGVFDADLYGPSIPTLVKVDNDTIIQRQDKMLVPPERDGVCFMSLGWLKSSQKRASVLRGPMLASMMYQILTQTAWEELDVLIIDLPPGTGDIHLTLSQKLQIDGAVVVTTPQQLSYIDVVKGIDMLQSTNTNILGLVENMSYFECTGCTEKHLIFGKGHLNELKKIYNISNILKLPLLQDISDCVEDGDPYLLHNAKGNVLKDYHTFAKQLWKHLDVKA